MAASQASGRTDCHTQTQNREQGAKAGSHSQHIGKTSSNAQPAAWERMMRIAERADFLNQRLNMRKSDPFGYR